MDADGGDFFLRDAATSQGPDAREFADALRHDAKLAAGADEHFFEQADIVHWAEVRTLFAREIAAQVDDRISHKLARPVIRHIAATVDLVQLDSALREHLVAGKYVGTMRITAKREDGRVFEQEERVADKILLTRRDDSLLDGEGFRVRDATETEEVDVHLKQFPKLFNSQAGVPDKTAHGEGIDRIIAWNNENAGSI